MNEFADVVYCLCALMSILCGWLLLRRYTQSRSRLLLWSGLAFLGLSVDNLLLFVDTIVLPNVDFSGEFWRNTVGAVSGSLLLFGLIWEVM